MTESEKGVLIIKGLISQLPEQDQREILRIKSSLRGIIEDNGSNGMSAVALLVAEIAQEEE